MILNHRVGREIWVRKLQWVIHLRRQTFLKWIRPKSFDIVDALRGSSLQDAGAPWRLALLCAMHIVWSIIAGHELRRRCRSARNLNGNLDLVAWFRHLRERKGDKGTPFLILSVEKNGQKLAEFSVLSLAKETKCCFNPLPPSDDVREQKKKYYKEYFSVQICHYTV